MLNALRLDVQRYRRDANEVLAATILKALYNHPSFAGVVWYRFSRALWLEKDNLLCFLLLIVMRFFYPLIRIYSGVELAPSVDIDSGLWIGHFGPTVIHPETRAGRNLTILHGTTIGAGTGGIPELGDDVSIGVGATIIGGIRIGNHVIIGAGAVVTKDVPDNHLAVGIPAQAIPQKK